MARAGEEECQVELGDYFVSTICELIVEVFGVWG